MIICDVCSSNDSIKKYTVKIVYPDGNDAQTEFDLCKECETLISFNHFIFGMKTVRQEMKKI